MFNKLSQNGIFFRPRESSHNKKVDINMVVVRRGSVVFFKVLLNNDKVIVTGLNYLTGGE